MKLLLGMIAIASATTAYAVEQDEYVLRQVQNEAHAKLKFLPEKDGKDNWQIPKRGYGDCEDYALFKRDRLLALGWPEDDIKIILVYNRQIGGHAALWIPSLNIVLDSPTDAKREQITPQNRDTWLDSKGYRFVCVFKDISHGDKGSAVSRRCQPN